MKKSLASALIIAFVIFLLAFCSGKGIFDYPISRTIMVYMIGSDLESKTGAATMDLAEMLDAGIDPEWVNIVVQTGGAKEWKNEVVSSDKNEIYEIAGDGYIKRVKEAPQKNMASPETLTEFLAFCHSNYESDAYSLILWDHGAGPMIGYGLDEISNDILSLTDIQEALYNSPFGKGNKLEFIGFDACLMGSVEIGFALKGYADYLIASQETEPGWGWNYAFLSEAKPDMGTEEAAVKIIDSYYEYAEVLFDLRPDFKSDITLSCLNLSKIDDVEKDLNELYSKAGDSLSSSTFPTASVVRNNVNSFGHSNTSVSYDLVDMPNLCALMSDKYSAEADKLLSALNDMIVYNKTNVPNAGGVSILSL